MDPMDYQQRDGRADGQTDKVKPIYPPHYQQLLRYNISYNEKKNKETCHIHDQVGSCIWYLKG